VFNVYLFSFIVCISVYSSIELTLINLVKSCRVYFSNESTQEMLDEWRPLLCPFDASMDEAMYYLEAFLPTALYPEEHETGYK